MKPLSIIPEIRCDRPAPESIQETEANGEYGDVITLHCVPGLKVQGDDTIAEFETTCTANGYWSVIHGCLGK